MADPRQVYWPLKNASDEGAAADALTSGDAAAAKVGALGFAFRDSSGNVVLPQLTSTGKLPVDTEAAAGTFKRARGEEAAGSVGVMVTVATLTLTVNKVYSYIRSLVSCRQDSLFQLVHNNNGVETILQDAVLGSGQFSLPVDLQDQITAGGTGTQQLLIKGQNFSKASALRGSLTCIEQD